MKIRTPVVVMLAVMAGLPRISALAGEPEVLTETLLAERGVEYLDDAALRHLIVGKTLTVRNLETGDFFEARYGTDGKRLISRVSEGTSPGTTTAETAPYVIHDARVTTSYRGRVFEFRIYHVEGKHLAARTADEGALKWEIVDVKE